jgi:DNA-binding cell septation regulator SpoVG
MSLDFSQHIPGQPYELTPTQFFNFLGLGDRIQDFSSMTKEGLLEILPKYRKVRIRTESEIWWEYKTEAKTVFQIQIIDGEMKFFVIIPANRDKDGRQHYNDLRIGNPYNMKPLLSLISSILTL